MTNKVQNLLNSLNNLRNEGNFSRIKTIVNDEFNIYIKNFGEEVPATFLGLAANVGDADLVEALLKMGADPNQEMQGYRAQSGPLHQVIYGAVDDAKGWIEDEVSNMSGRIKIMDMLVKAGAELNAMGSNGYNWTPIALASQYEVNNHAL